MAVSVANSRFRRVVLAEPETEDEMALPACFALGESASGGGAVSASAEASLLTLAGGRCRRVQAPLSEELQ